MPNRKTIIVGIDGGCWEYLEPFLAQGQLPYIEHLIKNGISGTLESVIPPISPVAWSSFITGMRPADHGVYGWQVRLKDSYTMRPIRSTDRKALPFWYYLNNAGIKTGIIGLPTTFPPQKLDGFLIAGFDSPPYLEKIIYPSHLCTKIKELYGDYHPHVSVDILRKEGIETYIRRSMNRDAIQTQIALDFADEFKVDVLIINYMTLDHFNHYLNDSKLFIHAWKSIDASIGILLQKMPDANYILISDHGSRRLSGGFLINEWLYKEGYISYDTNNFDIEDIDYSLVRLFKKHWNLKGYGEKILRNTLLALLRHSPKSIRTKIISILSRCSEDIFHHPNNIDYSKSRIYLCTTNHPLLYLNLENREPCGFIKPEDVKREIDELIAKLLRLEEPFTGEPLFSNIYKRQELYEGNSTGNAPDLVCYLEDSKCCLINKSPIDKGTLRGEFFTAAPSKKGGHTNNGMFIFHGIDFSKDTNVKSLRLIDITPLILHLNGIPIPKNFDGKVQTEYFSPEFNLKTPLSYQEGQNVETSQDEDDYYDVDGTERIKNTLKGLGYI